MMHCQSHRKLRQAYLQQSFGSFKSTSSYHARGTCAIPGRKTGLLILARMQIIHEDAEYGEK